MASRASAAYLGDTNQAVTAFSHVIESSRQPFHLPDIMVVHGGFYGHFGDLHCTIPISGCHKLWLHAWPLLAATASILGTYLANLPVNGCRTL
jgi:hypothetical protein